MNLEYAEGFVFFMLTFTIFLTCSVVSGELAKQIGLGYFQGGYSTVGRGDTAVGRGDAAAETWIFRTHVAATPRPRRGHSVEVGARRRYICPFYVWLNWLLDVINVFGVLCFIQATRWVITQSGVASTPWGRGGFVSLLPAPRTINVVAATSYQAGLRSG